MLLRESPSPAAGTGVPRSRDRSERYSVFLDKRYEPTQLPGRTIELPVSDHDRGYVDAARLQYTHRPLPKPLLWRSRQPVLARQRPHRCPTKNGRRLVPWSRTETLARGLRQNAASGRRRTTPMRASLLAPGTSNSPRGSLPPIVTHPRLTSASGRLPVSAVSSLAPVVRWEQAHHAPSGARYGQSRATGRTHR